VVSFTPRPLYLQGKSPLYPLDRRLDGPPSRSGCGGEEKNSQPPPGMEPYNSDLPARSPALYQLSYHGSTYVRICSHFTPTRARARTHTHTQVAPNFSHFSFFTLVAVWVLFPPCLSDGSGQSELFMIVFV
jgi:hypothetical protein